MGGVDPLVLRVGGWCTGGSDWMDVGRNRLWHTYVAHVVLFSTIALAAAIICVCGHVRQTSGEHSFRGGVVRLT